MEIGLALAGGGIPGCASVGVLKALDEAGFIVSHITGASSGAMVAALYAYGYSPEELENIVPRLNRRYLDIDWKAVILKLFNLRPDLEGWIKGDRLRGLMEDLTQKESLSAFKIPCGIVATDVSLRKPVVFSQKSIGDDFWEENILIADAVRASFSIPIIFRPLYRNGKKIVDGGVVSNCPVKICKVLGAKHVIAVDPISPITMTKTYGKYQSFYKKMYLQLKSQMEIEQQYADFVLFPETGFVGAFDFRKANQCIQAGYQTTIDKIDEIKKIFKE
jgi:NTE family protein